MHCGGSGFAHAKLAVEIPKIHTRRQSNAPLAFDVFADFVLDGFQHAIRVFAFTTEFECFFQVNLVVFWCAAAQRWAQVCWCGAFGDFFAMQAQAQSGLGMLDYATCRAAEFRVPTRQRRAR